jgi:hypothetical protein
MKRVTDGQIVFHSQVKKKISKLCFVFLFQVLSNVLFFKVMFSFSFSSANKTRQLVALGLREKTNYVCQKNTSLFFFCRFIEIKYSITFCAKSTSEIAISRVM